MKGRNAIFLPLPGIDLRMYINPKLPSRIKHDQYQVVTEEAD